MPREPKHASNRPLQAQSVDDVDPSTSKRQAAIDGDLPSRNQLKQHMQDLQELGEAVAGLPADRLAALKMEERLRDAIMEYRRTRSFEGKRRQLQFIGKLMKFEDPEPLREAVAAMRMPSAKETLALHLAETWRDRLIAADDMLTEWLKEYPSTDVQQMRNLVRASRKEKLEPGERHGRAFRDLFRLIREQMQDIPAPDDDGQDDPSHDD